MNKRILWLLVFLFLIFAVALGVIRSRVSLSPPALPNVAPQIVSFTASPKIINAGETVILSWATTGASIIAIRSHPEFHPGSSGEGQVGLPPWGTLAVHPQESMIYVLECESARGEIAASASASVRVR